ncbi:MAG TPA: hypothetical protein VIH59_18645, partial [Candidatus Tectomicrobia bacterium]
FRIAKFAEMVNPRMIAVAPDGTVYVTAREPGTLVMLRDADNDGVADVQRVVAEKKMLHGVAIHNGQMYLATVKEVFTALHTITMRSWRCAARGIACRRAVMKSSASASAVMVHPNGSSPSSLAF